jgi:Uma2 family endonuclease
MQKSTSMSQPARLVTAEELERFPRDDRRYELVAGRVVPMSPVGFDHGRIVSELIFLLRQHLLHTNAGSVFAELGVKLASRPDTVRAPDVSYIRRDRIPSPAPGGFWNGPPDLAIEVLSPDDRPGDVRDKVQEYLSHGVLVVVVVDPDSKTVAIHRPARPAVHVRDEEACVDLDDVVPGFRCTTRRIFN